jgi:hypothetical protein
VACVRSLLWAGFDWQSCSGVMPRCVSCSETCCCLALLCSLFLPNGPLLNPQDGKLVTFNRIHADEVSLSGQHRL